jgi:hypothetical protein
MITSWVMEVPVVKILGATIHKYGEKILGWFITMEGFD